MIRMMLAPVTPQNLKLSAILITIYQMLVAHVLLFLILMGLAHAKQMKTMLTADIEDEKENALYQVSPFYNQLLLHTASQLVNITETLLFIISTIATIYLLTTIVLFVGVFKNRSQFILPWLVLEFIFFIAAVILVLWVRNEKFIDLIGGKFYYYAICCSTLIFEALKWYIIKRFHHNLCTMNKLCEFATVSILCSAPGSKFPYPFRNEEIHSVGNDYNHMLYEFTANETGPKN